MKLGPRESEYDVQRRSAAQAALAQLDGLERALAEQRELVRALFGRQAAFQGFLEYGTEMRAVVELRAGSLVPLWTNRRGADLFRAGSPGALPADALAVWTEAAVGCAAQRASADIERRHAFASGARTLAVHLAHAGESPDGAPRVAVVASDVTAERLLEQQYLQAQKMEAAGRLAGGLAHDFGNLLGIVIGHAELLLLSFAADDPRREQVAEVLRAGEKGAKLTRQLLTFGRKQSVLPRVVDLAAVLTETSRMIQRFIGSDVAFRFDPGEGVAPVLMDVSQIDQIVMNLVVNARDAMPKGGRLVLEIAGAGEEAAVPPPLKPGRWVTLSLRDSGAGMTDEVKAHLFEPFYTTKEKGTGLGLATVYGIVKQAGGFVEVESAPGAGAAFRVFLPRAREEELPRTSELAAPPVPRGSETLLLVEEDDGVRSVLRETASSLGYHVLSASGAPAALELAAHHPGTIHVLVAELSASPSTGRELAQRLRLQRPGLKCLFLNGSAAGAGPLDTNSAILVKPVRREAFARKLRELLDRGAEEERSARAG